MYVEEFLGNTLLLVLTLMLVAIFGFGAVEIVQILRAEPAEIACSAKGMESRRQTFTTRVTCTPVAGYRSDSLTVKVVE